MWQHSWVQEKLRKQAHEQLQWRQYVLAQERWRQQEQEQQRQRQQQQEQERQRQQEQEQQLRQQREQRQQQQRSGPVPALDRRAVSAVAGAADWQAGHVHCWCCCTPVALSTSNIVVWLLLLALLASSYVAECWNSNVGADQQYHDMLLRFEMLLAAPVYPLHPLHYPIAHLLVLLPAQFLALMATGAGRECERSALFIDMHVHEALSSQQIGVVPGSALHMRRVFTLWGRHVLTQLFSLYHVPLWQVWMALCVLLLVAALGMLQPPLELIAVVHVYYVASVTFAELLAAKLVFAQRRQLDQRTKRSATSAPNTKVEAHPLYDSIDALEPDLMSIASGMSEAASSVWSCMWWPIAAVFQFCRWLAGGKVLLACVLGGAVVLHSVSLPWQHTLSAYTQQWYMQAPDYLACGQLFGLHLLMSFWAPSVQAHDADRQVSQHSNRVVVCLCQRVLWLMLLVTQCAGFAGHHPRSYKSYISQPHSEAEPELKMNEAVGFLLGCWQFCVTACYLAMHVPAAARWLLVAVQWVSRLLFCLACRAGNPWLGTLSEAWLVLAALSFWADTVTAGLAFEAHTTAVMVLNRVNWYGPYVYGFVLSSFALLHFYSWRAQIWWSAGQALWPAQLLWRGMWGLYASARARTAARRRQPAPTATTASSSSSRASKVAAVDQHSDLNSRLEAAKAEAVEDFTTCTLCYEIPRSVCVKPCGHVICCEPCFMKLQRNAGQGGKKGGRGKLLCPVCKEVVQQHVAGIRL